MFRVLSRNNTPAGGPIAHAKSFLFARKRILIHKLSVSKREATSYCCVLAIYTNTKSVKSPTI